MKRTGLMFLMLGAGLIFFACEKTEPLTDSGNDLETATLKAAKVERTFEGICTQVLPPAIEGDNEWYDQTNDWRTTGTSIWLTTKAEEDPDLGVTYLGGTSELFVDPKNPHELNRGKWDLTWEGTLTLKDLDNPLAGFDIVAIATGEGEAGKVKGMNAYWTYTMDFDGTPETMFYVVEGNIEKPQGPIKKD